MPIPKSTLKAMIRTYHGFDLTEEEMDLVMPELETYLREIEKLNELDLSDVMSARLLKVQEGGTA